MFERILIAMDKSEQSKRAAKKGVWLAKNNNASVIGVHVLDVDELDIMDVGSEEVALLKKEQRERGELALKYLEGLVKKEGLRYEKILTEGVPEKTILEVARNHSVDLIVLGTHGRKGIASLLDPELSDEIVKESPDCPIMVVP
ncbi:MAG TPA: universal stress protein [Euryarchaeota archaeon]|nr:universal stress protein [Euryarchaeota archaeon]